MNSPRIQVRGSVLVVLAVLTLGPAAFRPAAAKDYKLGFVDYDRVIEKYEAAIEAKKSMDTARTGFEAKAESLKTDWEKSKQEYESQQLTLSEEGKRAKMAEVEQRKKRYDTYVTDVYGKSGRIDQRYKELIAPIVDKIDSAVSKLAVDEGFVMVLDASKAGVVYAQSGLDITQLVIDELNREFAPVGPTAETTQVYAVMPVYNDNDQAAQDRIGGQIRELAYRWINDQPKTDMIANPKTDQKLTDIGVQGQKVEQDKALEAARALDADFVVFGTCTKQDRRIEFELSLANVRLGTLVRTEKGEVSRTADLQEGVAKIVRVLLAAVEKP
jgi:outer membrane protein